MKTEVALENPERCNSVITVLFFFFFVFFFLNLLLGIIVLECLSWFWWHLKCFACNEMQMSRSRCTTPRQALCLKSDELQVILLSPSPEPP